MNDGTAGVQIACSAGLPSSNNDIPDWFAGREPFRQAFLRQCGWQGAAVESMGEDCAWRRYFRLKRGDRTAVLMEALPKSHAVATPGHDTDDFIRIGLWLREQGINTPVVYEADAGSGYLLLEDFGDVSFRQALRNKVPATSLYELATDVLVRMRGLADPPPLPPYAGSHVDQGRRRVVDWYMPVVLGRRNPDGTAKEYLALWAEIEESLPECPTGFLHIDYHVENLMWMPDRDGMARCGVLDFQGAMQGPVAYDLANLLEDPRQDIPANLRREMLERFCAGLPRGQRDVFAAWYRILAAQFHCRVIGQFVKLALTTGKTRYLPFIPRLESYIRDDLDDPLLAPLKDWFAERGSSFTAGLADVPPDGLALIRPDAF